MKTQPVWICQRKRNDLVLATSVHLSKEDAERHVCIEIIMNSLEYRESFRGIRAEAERAFTKVRELASVKKYKEAINAWTSFTRNDDYFVFEETLVSPCTHKHVKDALENP
jgi:hypothetical protein